MSGFCGRGGSRHRGLGLFCLPNFSFVAVTMPAATEEKSDQGRKVEPAGAAVYNATKKPKHMGAV